VDQLDAATLDVIQTAFNLSVRHLKVRFQRFVRESHWDAGVGKPLEASPPGTEELSEKARLGRADVPLDVGDRAPPVAPPDSASSATAPKPTTNPTKPAPEQGASLLSNQA